MKTRVSSKGQVVIPKAYRQKLGWENGTHLEVHEEAGQLVLSKPKQKGKTVAIETLAGRLHRPGAAPISLQAMEDAITKEVRKRND
jgi:AbrB family looped-hinge helix DNA binding protein